MFKTLSSLEKTMRSILINLNRNNSLPDVETDKKAAYALYCCCMHRYVLNLATCQNANRDYLFQKTGNVHVSEEGLQFLKETSFLVILARSIFTLLRGAWGFLLGVLSSLLVVYLIKYFEWQ